MTRLLAVFSWLAACSDGGAPHDTNEPPVDLGDDDASPDGDADADADADGDADPDPTGDPCLDPVRQDAVVAMLADGLAASGVPGGAIAITCGSEVVRAEGLGVVTAGGDAVTAKTRFQLASITKPLTAATVMTLVDEGLLALDAPVAEHVPFVNTRAPYDRDATLEELMSHSAGYPTEFPDMDGSDPSLEGTFRNNGAALLWSPPGAVFNYSNLGFALVGLVAERVSGTAFATLVEERLFEPAGMTGATMDTAALLEEGEFASGHMDEPSNAIGPTDWYYGEGWYGPMGGAWASVEDLARFGLLLSGRVPGVLSDDALAEMRRPRISSGWPGTDYGLGLLIEPGPHGARVSHDGSVAGFLTAFSVLPDTGAGVYVLVNGDWWSPVELAMEGAATLGDWEPAEVEDRGPDAEQIVGTYEDAVQVGVVQVRAAGAGLELVFPDLGGTTTPLEELWPGSWGYFDPLWQYDSVATFWPAEDGGVGWLVSLSFVAAREP